MSAISRSEYQKVVEENKRLLKDIRLITNQTISPEQVKCICKWRDKFKKEKEEHEVVKNLILQSLKN